MALKINVKPLKGDQFEVEAQPDAKVSDLKKIIEGVRADFPADGQKLIHMGKILKDDDTVESIGIKPTEFLVVMATKAKPPAPKAAAPAAAASATAPATPATPAAPGAGETAPAAAGGDAAGQAAANVVTGAGMEAAVTQLMEMGFPREQVEQALAAAFGNPDRAVEYLMNGIPDTIMSEAAGGGAGGPPAAPAGDVGAAAPTTPAAGGIVPGAVAIPPELAAIRDNPQFTQLAGMIASNPQIIGQLLPALQQSHPEIAQAITQNPQAFLQMVAETVSGGGDAGGDPVAAMLAAAGGGGGGGGGGGAPPGQTVIRLTEDERGAVERLAALGFDPQMAVQAYLACDKNEELAANFLFDTAGDDMQD